MAIGTVDPNNTTERRLHGLKPNHWLRDAKPPLLRILLSESGTDPQLISFSVGLPAPELLPAALFEQASTYVLRNDRLALQMGPPFASLKTAIVKLMWKRGVHCHEREILLTSGAQQGLDLVARLLLSNNSEVLVEDVTFPGVLQAIEPFGPKITPIQTDPATGLNVEVLSRVLSASDPAFLYLIPTGHNPLGINMLSLIRSKVIDLAREHKLLVVEDDTYGLLGLSGDGPPALRSLDREWVVYVGSFSKSFAPGLRLGWMVVPERFAGPLAILKDLTEVDSCTFNQRVMARIIESGDFDIHLESLKEAYRLRRDAMIQSLEKHLKAEAEWVSPNNGFFVWTRFRNSVDTAKLLPFAVRHGNVTFAPGIAFAPRDDPHVASAVRLSFSHAACDQIETGVARLAEVLRDVAAVQ